MLQMFSDYLKVILQIANVVVLGYALFKFLGKPHTTLEERVNEHESRLNKHDVKIEEIGNSLHNGNDKFREQEKTNATFKSVMLSFINFEIAYCRSTGYEDNQDLLDAKKELSSYLTGKNHESTDRD